MTEPEEDDDWSGRPCPLCGAHTYWTTPNARPDITLLVCLDCGWEEEHSATELRNQNPN